MVLSQKCGEWKHSGNFGRMPFLPPNQQRQSTEGNQTYNNNNDRLTAFDPGQPG